MAKLYDARWPLTGLAVAAVAGAAMLGWQRVERFSRQVDSLSVPPPEEFKPKLFDARYDVWFDPDDPGLQTYQRIEEQFAAEDFVLAAFEVVDHPDGVFSRPALEVIEELTARFERIPAVRLARSLTNSPWIRTGDLDDGAGGVERGLLVTDLFAGGVAGVDDAGIVERAVAVLGGAGAAALLGEARVRAVLGEDADFAEFIGEPRMVGNVVSADGRTAAIQVQMLNPRLSVEELRAAFGDDPAAHVVGRQMHGNSAQWRALDAMQDAIAAAGGGFEFHLAGMPTFERNFFVVGEQDIGVAGWMFVVIALVLGLAFRRVAGVITPLLVVFGSIAAMLGTIWLLGDLLNNITATAPNMVTAISIADAVHLCAAYYALRHGFTERRALILEVLRRTAVPVFLTSVTTAIGFFSLTTGNIIPMQMLGYTAGMGALYAYALSMTVVPAVLSLLPLPAPSAVATGAADAPHWSAAVLAVGLRFRHAIVAGAAVVAIAALIGLTMIELNTDFRAAFPDDNRTMRDLQWIEHRLSGGGDLELVFAAPPAPESGERQRARERRIEQLAVRVLGAEQQLPDSAPLDDAERQELAQLRAEEAEVQRRRIAVSAEFLRELRRFTDALRVEMRDPDSPLHIVTRLDGALDVLRKMHQVQNDNRAAFYRPPTEDDVAADARAPRLWFDEITEEVELIPAQSASTLVAQYYLQYENGARPAENLSTLISADRSTVRVQGRLRQAPTTANLAAFARIREIAKADFPTIAASLEEVQGGSALSSLTLSGKMLLYAGMTDKFARGFVRSMALALALITVLIGIIYRSVVMAALSVVPNVLPIVVPIGVFGLFGWQVDGPAVFVSSVALGVCVDDTIHLFTQFTRARRAGATTEAALRVALGEVGNAITFTTLILVLGFAVLALSQFKPNAMMGKLAAVMIALAWVADFVVTPALLSLLPDPNRNRAAPGTVG